MKTTEALNKEIKSIATAGAKLDKMIQNTAVGVAEHFAAHKDTGLVNRLFLAMPKGSRRTALADWLLKFVAVSVSMDASSKKEQPFIYDKSKTTDPVAGAETMWYDLKAEKSLEEVFDVATMVRSMLNRMNKAAKLDHFNPEADKAMRQLAHAVGIKESDVPTTLAQKAVKPAEPAKKAPAKPAKSAAKVDPLTVPDAA